MTGRRHYAASVRSDRTRAADDAGVGPPTDPDALARTLCLRQLEARSRTRVELERYLARKGIPEDAADRVLDRFTEVGLVDDATLAQSFASSRQSEQGLARRAIAAKLRQRGVADDLVAMAVASFDADDELAAARRLVAKRMGAVAGLEPAAQTRRLVGLLGRKGYSPGLAYRVVKEALADRGNSSEFDGDSSGEDSEASSSGGGGRLRPLGRRAAVRSTGADRRADRDW
jgi:regulatory protein